MANDSEPSIPAHDRPCVLERVPHLSDEGWQTDEVWHVDLAPERFEADWTPIACGHAVGLGICLPGHPVDRQPTCPECIQIVGAN